MWRNDMINNDQSILKYIESNNFWNIWVRKEQGGRECTLPVGLKILENLAYQNGSLGWLVTLVSGANYFLGFIDPRLVKEITAVPGFCLGGSGKVADKAVKTDNGYLISGEWQYATGAPFLTHFTLNAKVYDHDGAPVLNSDGTPLYKSFVVSSDFVEMIDSWNAMGMEKTFTKNYRLSNVFVPGYAAFEISPQKINSGYLIHRFAFNSFAAFTLAINYIGMFRRFLVEINKIVSAKTANQKWNEMYGDDFTTYYIDVRSKFTILANSFQEITDRFWQYVEADIDVQPLEKEVYDLGKHITRLISHHLNPLSRYGGLSAAQKDAPVNIVYRDLTTALQHTFFL
ncbi:acyl-CoA dehydrogenase family protein [Polluticaenibacter yanchengensis]|uniref:Acyl-CoA dehydrogenase n=1 Tax=Polluticaenibacter yanchengensis TaxID=3014562 RepID=A0ABT4UN78_9BACT|nr:hypothetical protein [Chitinophagaceae bacterium LY-5]